eukprot:TRINITY_DN49602_c0_g1_i2.p1 TRINITY_DN49602_c0_g1~~TRINITY_DN49602_c0_g1_i2.p1  ORF type:complete len:546 (+),score=156.41 TRINITY_DN49602_c0_g1_i2:57-1694(+)
MEAGLRALAELEEEARDLQKAHIANRRQLRENAIEAQRDRLAASIARKTEKINRFEVAKEVRHLAWQHNQKNQKTAEYKLKLKLEEETNQRRRKMVDRSKKKKTGRKLKPRPSSAPPDSPLLRELSLEDSASVRDALLGVAASEEESAELQRIFDKIGASSSRSSVHESVSTIEEEFVCDAKVVFKQSELHTCLTLQAGCSELRCAGVMYGGKVNVNVAQSMPLGQNALQWLAEGAGLKHDPEKGCVGGCGCVLSLQCPELREYLEDKLTIGVAHLSQARAAHLVPCSSHVLAELQASGIQTPAGFCPDEETVLMIVREPAQKSRAVTPARAANPDEGAQRRRETKLKARYLAILEEAVAAGKQRKPRASQEEQDRGELAGVLIDLGDQNPNSAGLLQLKQEVMHMAEVDEAERTIFQKLLIKLQAGRNPTQLFWEINRAHDGFVSLQEWRGLVMELGLKGLDAGHVKESFERMAVDNRMIGHKSLLGKLREYQMKLYGQKKNYLREWHQKGEGQKPDAKKLQKNLYNPKPYATQSLSFSFRGAA